MAIFAARHFPLGYLGILSRFRVIFTEIRRPTRVGWADSPFRSGPRSGRLLNSQTFRSGMYFDSEMAILAVCGFGMFLILPIATMIMLAKIRREQSTALKDLKREMQGLRFDLKGRQTAAERPVTLQAPPHAEPLPRPELVSPTVPPVVETPAIGVPPGQPSAESIFPSRSACWNAPRMSCWKWSSACARAWTWSG